MFLCGSHAATVSRNGRLIRGRLCSIERAWLFVRRWRPEGIGRRRADHGDAIGIDAKVADDVTSRLFGQREEQIGPGQQSISDQMEALIA